MFTILRQRDFGLLWFAGLISITGDLALTVALPLHIYKLTDSTLATAAAFAANLLPRVLFGSMAGVFVDRWDRRRTMIFSDLSRAIMLLPLIAVSDHLVLLYVIAAIQGTIALLFFPAESALLPMLVGPDKLVAANAMNALNQNLGMLVGPALGALLYSVSGLASVAIFDAVTYVISAGLIALIATRTGPPKRAPSDVSPWRQVRDDFRAGTRIIRHDRSLSIVFIATALSGVAEGVFITLGLAPLVLDVFKGTEAQVGWLGAAQAVGGIAASIIIVRTGHRFSRRKLFSFGAIGLGLADFTAFHARLIAGPGTPAVGVAMACMTVAGIPVVAGGTGRQSIVQVQAGDEFRGRVFGSLLSAQGIAMLIGVGIGGVLGGVIGIVPVLSVSALLRVVGGAIAFVCLPRDEAPLVPETQNEEPAPSLSAELAEGALQ